MSRWKLFLSSIYNYESQILQRFFFFLTFHFYITSQAVVSDVYVFVQHRSKTHTQKHTHILEHQPTNCTMVKNHRFHVAKKKNERRKNILEKMQISSANRQDESRYSTANKNRDTAEGGCDVVFILLLCSCFSSLFFFLQRATSVPSHVISVVQSISVASYYV